MQLLHRIRNKLQLLGEVRLPFRNVSFSAAGEDLIVADVFRRIGVQRPFYFDVGANHPIRMNNTFAFYRAGGRGICVEPQPLLCEQIRHLRPKDECLNVGITGANSGSLTFYVFDNPSLSTFSKAHAELLDRRGPYRIVQTTSIPTMPVNDLLARVPDGAASFLSLDCEGMDLEILSSIDFGRYRPAVLCVETARPSVDGSTELGSKIVDFDVLLRGHDYWPFADNYVNTIYVDRRRLRLAGP